MERIFDVRVKDIRNYTTYGNRVVAQNEKEAIIKFLSREDVEVNSTDKIVIRELF